MEWKNGWGYWRTGGEWWYSGGGKPHVVKEHIGSYTVNLFTYDADHTPRLAGPFDSLEAAQAAAELICGGE